MKGPQFPAEVTPIILYRFVVRQAEVNLFPPLLQKQWDSEDSKADSG